MRINLADIPEEGKSFKFNNNTAELNQDLKDLIGNTPYETEFYIRPLDATNFEIAGSIQTKVQEQCSRCAMDFDFKINKKFRELLVHSLKLDRDEQYTKSNHFSELTPDAPNSYEYTGTHLEIGEYIHEVVAFSVPFNPSPETQANGDCALCDKNIHTSNFSYSDKEVVKESPFASLKGIKLE